MRGTTAKILSDAYTDETVVGGGAIKGKNCVVKSIVDNPDGTHIITMGWTLDDGTQKQQSYIVKDGVDGKDGLDGYTPIKDVDYFDGEKGDRGATGIGITSIDKTGSSGLVDTYTITLSDGSESTFNVINGANLTKLSELENDENFIKATTMALVNYYMRDEVYSKAQIDELMRNFGAGISLDIVDVLPTENISPTTIYLLNAGGSNFNQYIHVNGEWRGLGSTSVDMSNYYTKAQLDNKLEDYVTANRLTNKLDDYVQKANLSKVGKTGSYNDLEDLPEIPSTEGFMKGRQMLGETDLNDCITEGTFTVASNSSNLPSIPIYGAYVDLQVLSINTVVSQIIRCIVAGEPMMWSRCWIVDHWTEWVHAISSDMATDELVNSSKSIPTSKALYGVAEKVDDVAEDVEKNTEDIGKNTSDISDLFVNLGELSDALDGKENKFLIASNIASDLNTLEVGHSAIYNASTTNKPSEYGYVVCYGGVNNPNWKYQIAFGTYNNEVYVRENINGDGWTNWSELATMDKVAHELIIDARAYDTIDSAWSNIIYPKVNTAGFHMMSVTTKGGYPYTMMISSENGVEGTGFYIGWHDGMKPFRFNRTSIYYTFA